ncbi:unnamed protein product [Gordionus sp. m RMFG-2023]|uniref:coatomer subunit zeta-1-like n=1 Tax=Gordionus sp. m RMFG-2023 TaxID=3053472 RepID=UPI0030E5D0CC
MPSEETFLPPSLYVIKAILILDNDGNRLISKYYDNTFNGIKEQKAFEKNLFTKTYRANSEIMMLDGLTCLYKSNVDIYFYIIGSQNENPIMLLNILNTLYDTVNIILRKNIEKKYFMENLDLMFLAIDEICDRGIFMTSSPSLIIQQIMLRNDDIPLTEQTMAQVYQAAKDQLKYHLMK